MYPFGNPLRPSKGFRQVRLLAGELAPSFLAFGSARGVYCAKGYGAIACVTGPKGTGALVARRAVRWQPFIRGGPQERDRRGGTENVAGIVGMGQAAAIAAGRLLDPNYPRLIGQLRDKLETGILNSIPESHVNGDTAHRLANTTNIGFDGLEAEAILILLSQMDICASAGAACSSGSLEPSHVLRAMHIAERTAHGSIRFSLSDFTTLQEIQSTLEILPEVIHRLRKVLPVA